MSFLRLLVLLNSGPPSYFSRTSLGQGLIHKPYITLGVLEGVSTISNLVVNVGVGI